LITKSLIFKYKNLTKILFKSSLNKIIILLGCLFLFTSCTDKGCIEADDFGEYQSQTLTVSANLNADLCKYYPSLALSDSTQGGILKSCFISSTPNIADPETGEIIDVVANKGCIQFSNNAAYQQECINACQQQCLSSLNSSYSAPAWIATDQTLTLSALSQIYINARGNINLGTNSNTPNIYVSANNASLHSLNASWGNIIMDVKKNQALQVKFSGQWQDGSSNIVFGSGSDIDASQKAYNGGRTLAAYVISAPNGYDFDYSQTSEKAGAKGVPLYADPNLWQCNYSGSNIVDSNCFSGNYDNNSNYSSSVDNVATLAIYNITSNGKADNLGTMGGMIRWNNDGLLDNSYDPFNINNCDSGNCGNISVSPNIGKIIGDLSSANGVFITNNNPYAVSVSFKPLLSSNSCGGGGINVALKITNNAQDIDVPLNRSKWSDMGSNKVTIALEAGKTLKIAQNSTAFNANGNIINCGIATAVRFLPYQDILISKSGLVSFKILGGNSAAGSCTLVGRIINPTGSNIDINSSFTADFYEYDSFNASSSIDPLNSLTVNAAANSSAIWSSNQIMVRKGQVIRFAAQSWSNNWTSQAGNRQCGIGMAMKIEERPALLCRGYSDEGVSNLNCKYPDITTGNLTGCMASALECLDSTNSTYYCPTTCQETISCTNGNSSNFYQKFDCTSTPLSDQDFTSKCGNIATATKSKCSACANLQITNATIAAQIPLSIIQCYDLENYTGKVSNISASTGFTSAQLSNSSLAKKAVKLNGFNGSYGNFANLALLTPTTDASSSDDPPDSAHNNNIIYGAANPLIFTKNGRLKFLVLDGSDFLNLNNKYIDNLSNAGSGYNGTNGYQISFNNQLDFNNGQWLEAMICKESSANSNDCSAPIISFGTKNDVAANNNGVPRVVELNNSTTQTIFLPTTKTSFNFDNSGNLTRIKNNSTTPPQPNDILVPIGSIFYVHNFFNLTNQEITNLIENPKTLTNDQKTDISRLKLSFKIKDPEIPNCNIEGDNNPATYNAILLPNPAYSNVNNCSRSGDNDPKNPPILDGVTKITAVDSQGAITSTNCVSNTGNTGTVCQTTESASLSLSYTDYSAHKTQCLKQFYCGNPYANNSGQYYVTVRIKDPNNNISSLVSSIIQPVIEIMDGSKDPNAANAKKGQAQLIYELIINDVRYKSILSMAMVLMFSFYGFGYLMGVSELTHVEVMNRVIKIGLICLFVGPFGWYWFNNIIVKFFKNGTDYIAFLMATSFDDPLKQSQLASAISSGDYYDKSILFTSVDTIFGMIFSSAIINKVGALLFSGIFGPIYLFIIYLSFFLYVYSIANAVLLYLTSQVFISILFILGPIFFIFPLFNQTKAMFDNWLKALIGLSLQQIFLLTTLTFFNMLIYEVIKMSLGYKVCWDEVWTINILTRINLLSFWKIASLPPGSSQAGLGNINSDGIPSLFSILYIWIIASIMNKFIGFVTNLASSIAAGLSIKGVADHIGAIAREQFWNLKNNSKNLMQKTKIGRTLLSIPAKLDDKLFDLGQIADQRREAAKKQKKEDNKNIQFLRKAGKEAIDNYKKANGADFASLSKEDKANKLTEVRNNAINSKATEIGLDLTQIKRLTALKPTGIDRLKDKASLEEEKIDTIFTRSQINAALKNTNAEGRQAILASASSDKLEIARSKSEIAADAFNSVRKGAEITVKTTAKATKDIALSVGAVTASVAGVAIGAVPIGAVFAYNAIKSRSFKSAAKTAADSFKSTQKIIDSNARAVYEKSGFKQDLNILKGVTSVAAKSLSNAKITRRETVIKTSSDISIKEIKTTITAKTKEGVIAVAKLAAGTGAIAVTAVVTTAGTGIAGLLAPTGIIVAGVGGAIGAPAIAKSIRHPIQSMGKIAAATDRALSLAVKSINQINQNIKDKEFKQVGKQVFAGVKNSISAVKSTLAAPVKGGAAGVKAAAKLTDKFSKEVVNIASKSGNFGKEMLKDSVGLAIKKAYETTTSNINSEYNRASKELEKRGEINIMAANTGWARAENEKQKILDHVKENQKQSEVKKNNNNVRDLKNLEKFSQALDAKNGAISANSSANKTIIQDRDSRFRQNIQEQLINARAEKTTITNSINNARNNIKDLEKDPKINKMKKAVMRLKESQNKDYKEKLAAKKELEDLKESFKNDPNYKQKSQDLKQEYAQLHELKEQRDNINKKLPELEVYDQMIQDSDKINDQIQFEPVNDKIIEAQIEAQADYNNLGGSIKEYERYIKKYEDKKATKYSNLSRVLKKPDDSNNDENL
jgi:type IV secretory pathway VirB6-like protein